MRRFAQVTQLLPEAEAEYVRCHEQVWPQVLGIIAECGMANYSIFLHHGLLFAYFEYHGEDYAADMQKLAANTEMQRWWRMTDAMQRPLAGTPDGRIWAQMQEVFYFDPKV